MPSSSIKTHGIWALALIASFFLGNRWQERSQAQQSAPTSSARPQPANSPRSSNSSTQTSSGPTRSNRERVGPAGGGLEELLDLTPASAANLEALTLEALRDPSQVKRRLAFSRLLSQLTPENAAAIRDQLVAAGAGGSEWRDFNYAWGAIAGEAAFNNSLTADKKNLESLISGWAATDPAGAINMLGKLPPELADQRTQLENGIVAGLADRDRDEATRYVTSLLEGGREDAGRLMETVANEVLRKGGPEEASAWAATIENPALKGTAMSEVAERYVREDPVAAAGWIEQFAKEEFATGAVARVGRSWAEREPLAAVNWLDQLPEGPGQKAGLNSAFGDWEDKDPVAAGQYLLSMPDSPKRDSAISGFANGYAWQDPQTALAWANDIRDPNLRTESLKRVGRAYFRRNPDEAQTWLANSGLPSEVQAEIQASRDRRR